jgi:IS1 family transposase
VPVPRSATRIPKDSVPNPFFSIDSPGLIGVWRHSKHTTVGRDDPERGEFFTYLSVDMSSKLIINYRIGKRTTENTDTFLRDLKNRMGCRFQLTTDAYVGYWRGCGGAVERIFGNDVDYATETKIFSKRETSPYSSPHVIATRRKQRIGNPQMNLATTCHAERMNLSVRLFNRRFTRKTLGFSKKLANLHHAVALFVAHFNFCRVHSAHGRTPAQAAGLAENAWNISDLINSAI